MTTAAQVVKAAQTAARDYYLQTDVVVMNKADFRALLEDTARQAFEAGRAGPAKSKSKPKPESRKRALKSVERFGNDWEDDDEEGWT